MADVENSQSPVSVKLSSLNLGNISVRFVCLVESQYVLATRTPQETQGVPLFLASDVLCGSLQMPKNFTRIHARYAKVGLATKLFLKDFRVRGMKHSTNVWFYSIHGLFQVVFEYQSKAVQKDCLSKLKDIWLSRYHDDSLPKSLTVTLHTAVMSPCVTKDNSQTSCVMPAQELSPLEEEDIIAGNDVRNNFLDEETAVITSTSNASETECKVNSDEKLDKKGSGNMILNSESTIHVENIMKSAGQVEKGAIEQLFKNVSSDIEEGSVHDHYGQDDIHQTTATSNPASKTCGSGSDTCLQHKTSCFNKATQIDTVPKIIKKISVGVQTSNIEKCRREDVWRESHDFSSQTDITMDRLAILVPCSYNRINTTNNVIQQIQKYSSLDLFNECQHVLKTFLNYLLLRQRDNPYLDVAVASERCYTILQLLKSELHHSENEGFPFCLIKEYLNMLKTEPEDTQDNSWNIPWERHAFLYVTSHWLGQEFHKFESAISQRVEDFKQRHINCIDNLPPAENIIDLVFPECMKELVTCWTGGGMPHHHGKTDHGYDYSPPQKKTRTGESASITFPLVQHILEFANHALVSGVAHVVYSRLRHSI